MTEYNGGFKSYPAKTKTNVFFKAKPYDSKQVTIKSGQVLKERTFLESDADGKLIAHSGLNEKALITFPTKIDATETVIIAGLTFTAGAAAVSQAALVNAWSGLTAGTTAAQANALTSPVGGTFTAGTLTGYNSVKSSTTGAVLFISTTPNAGVTDLTVTGTGDASTVTVTSVNSPQKKIAGVTMYDVDASSGDVTVSVYKNGSFYANALKWSNNPVTDFVEKPDGTTVACTDYYTGATTNDLKKKFVEDSGFSDLGFQNVGEVY
jgi:hypothetical protein